MWQHFCLIGRIIGKKLQYFNDPFKADVGTFLSLRQNNREKKLQYFNDPFKG